MFVEPAPSPVYMENEPVIEFDRNPNALRDEILSGHSWTLGEDGALAVPVDRSTAEPYGRSATSMHKPI